MKEGGTPRSRLTAQWTSDAKSVCVLSTSMPQPHGSDWMGARFDPFAPQKAGFVVQTTWKRGTSLNSDATIPGAAIHCVQFQ